MVIYASIGDLIYRNINPAIHLGTLNKADCRVLFLDTEKTSDMIISITISILRSSTERTIQVIGPLRLWNDKKIKIKENMTIAVTGKKFDNREIWALFILKLFKRSRKMGNPDTST